jgi:hypothetical protein
MLDTGLFRAEVSLVVGALVVTALRGLIVGCNRRGGMSLSGAPIWTGLVVRLAAVAVAAAFPAVGHKLTSTDEAAFLATSHRLAALPFSDGRWLSMAAHWTEVVPWALTFKLFGDCGVLPLRLEQIGFSLAAVIIVSAIATRIGGRRAGLIAAWVAALEPSSVYFAGLLHQESLCMLGEALLLAGLVDVWIRLRQGDRLSWQTAGLALVGLALIFGTRAYMAFFAGVAVVLVLAGAVVCGRLGLFRGLLALTLGAMLVFLAGILAAPHVVPRALASLQYQLNYNYVGANLALGHATVTNSGGLLKTLVERTIDLLLRPYPWQVGSTAQKVAVAGTLLWYALVLIAVTLVARVGLDEWLVPVVILAVCETVGFGLTLIDAGEGFRHRINLILMLAVSLGVLADGLLPARSSGRFAHHMNPVGKTRAARPRALGAIVGGPGALGLVVALGISTLLPVRYIATVTVAIPAAGNVSAPAGAGFTPSASLYGAIGPGVSRSLLTFTTTARTPDAARASAGGAARRWHSHTEGALRSRTTIPSAAVARSPRRLRDALLGLLAGLLVGLAACLVSEGP